MPIESVIYDEDLRGIGARVAALPADLSVNLPGVSMSAGELAAAFRDALAYRTSRPAPDPLRQAAKDVAPHVRAWTVLLEEHVQSLPEDGEPGSGDAARSYAEHELRAMRRDLGALTHALVVTA